MHHAVSRFSHLPGHVDSSAVHLLPRPHQNAVALSGSFVGGAGGCGPAHDFAVAGPGLTAPRPARRFFRTVKRRTDGTRRMGPATPPTTKRQARRPQERTTTQARSTICHRSGIVRPSIVRAVRSPLVRCSCPRPRGRDCDRGGATDERVDRSRSRAGTPRVSTSPSPFVHGREGSGRSCLRPRGRGCGRPDAGGEGARAGSVRYARSRATVRTRGFRGGAGPARLPGARHQRLQETCCAARGRGGAETRAGDLRSWSLAPRSTTPLRR